MTEDWKQAAVRHAEAETPRESCGLLVLLDGAEHYWPCKNLSDEDDVFILDFSFLIFGFHLELRMALPIRMIVGI